jgi:Recombination endonuclease VII
MGKARRRILTDEEVNGLRARFRVKRKRVVILTPEQKLKRRESVRQYNAARSADDLDVKVQRFESWVGHLHKQYGVSLEWYETTLAEQRGLCAICGQHERVRSNRGTGAVRRLCVDHNHQNGRVRELLCHFCNTQLGALENMEWRVKAEAYLVRHERVDITQV